MGKLFVLLWDVQQMQYKTKNLQQRGWKCFLPAFDLRINRGPIVGLNETMSVFSMLLPTKLKDITQLTSSKGNDD